MLEPDGPARLLVTAEWLSQHLNDRNLVVLDCTVLVEPNDDGSVRVVSGRANYDSGHFPTAAFAGLMGDLSDGDSPLQFALPVAPQHSSPLLYDRS